MTEPFVMFLKSPDVIFISGVDQYSMYIPGWVFARAWEPLHSSECLPPSEDLFSLPHMPCPSLPSSPYPQVCDDLDPEEVVESDHSIEKYKEALRTLRTSFISSRLVFGSKHFTQS